MAPTPPPRNNRNLKGGGGHGLPPGQAEAQGLSSVDIITIRKSYVCVKPFAAFLADFPANNFPVSDTQTGKLEV